MNKMALIGRLTADVELRTTQSGKNVCSFVVAVDRPGNDAGADFITCVAWEKTAELIARYFRKGSKIGLTGRVTTRNWEDKDGHKRKETEVMVESFDFCEKAENGQNPGVPEGFAAYPADLPF